MASYREAPRVPVRGRNEKPSSMPNPLPIMDRWGQIPKETSMRRILAGWAALAILAGTAVAQNEKPAAVVNGETIPMSEIEAAMASRPMELFPVPAAQQRQAKLEILDVLIGERLMKQFLVKSGATVDSTDVEKQMAALTQAQKEIGKTLAAYCRESNQTEAQVRAGVSNMLQFQAYAKKIATDDELKKYFQANLDYFQKVTVRCSHIVLRVGADATDAEKQEARKKLTAIREKLTANPENFADAAKENSQCPSAPKGGDIGYITRKWMVDEPVAKAAFALKKGEMSGIVESEFGLHIILNTDRTDAKPIEFAECKDDVRDCFVEELRQKLLVDLRRSAKVKILLP
jgi:parvulin-like peptidyl-prolyl isomerase